MGKIRKLSKKYCDFIVLVLVILLLSLCLPEASVEVTVGCASVYVAFSAHRYTKQKDEKSNRTDLRNVVFGMASFVNWGQAFLQHNIVSTSDADKIARQILEANKDIIRIESINFFNDSFDIDIVKKVSSFLLEYNTWRNRSLIKDTEIFDIFTHIYKLSTQAIELLELVLTKFHHDEYIRTYLEETLKGAKEIKEQNTKFCNMKHIEENLEMLFSYTPLLSFLQIFLIARGSAARDFSQSSRAELRLLIIRKIFYYMLIEENQIRIVNILFYTQLQQDLRNPQNYLCSTEIGHVIDVISLEEIFREFSRMLI